jgi:hypothetical protein
MALPDRGLRRPTLVDTANIIISLAKETKHPRFVEFREYSDRNAHLELVPPLNVFSQEIAAFRNKLNSSDILNSSQSTNSHYWDIDQQFIVFDRAKLLVKPKTLERHTFDRPYWDSRSRYKMLDVVGGTIQFIDDHSSPLPQTVLPPEKDVRKYINTILESPQKLTVSEQFEKLLEITDNNIVGAANLGFIASRFMARASDFRAYQGIDIQPQDMDRWNAKIAQFATDDGSKTSDGPGDTYYFWTYVFALSVNEAFGSKTAKKLAVPLFNQGTEFMIKFKNTFTNEPPSTHHREATYMGRRVGELFADHISENVT